MGGIANPSTLSILPGEEVAIRLWDDAHRVGHSKLKKVLLAAWTVVGLLGLGWFAWAEPFSAMLFAKLLSFGVAPWVISYIGIPLVMVIRAVILVETIGYAYHRFFQHLGHLTRTIGSIRRNQMFHWHHHMILYRYGKGYRHKGKYKGSESGIPWSWAIPTLLVIALAIWSMGLNLGTLVFIAAMIFYIKAVVALTHDRFHQEKHPWSDSRYFRWLGDIHILHHYDQRTNYTIVHPLMDMLFGTYMSPQKHLHEVAACEERHVLSPSDLINWLIMLREARPEERALLISNIEKYNASKKMLRACIDTLKVRLKNEPQDARAEDLLHSAERLAELASLEVR